MISVHLPYIGLVVAEGVTSMVVFGVVFPIAMAFVWAIFLWFFAGVIVYVLIAALMLSMLYVLSASTTFHI